MGVGWVRGSVGVSMTERVGVRTIDSRGFFFVVLLRRSLVCAAKEMVDMGSVEGRECE